jgi:hyperosmotically inducible protein
MRRHGHLAGALVGLIVVLADVGTTAQTPQAKNTIAEIRKELLQLPYYGVFDFIAFRYDKGTVTLQGYAYQDRLKTDAERAVKRASGVDQVVDQIEVLPVAPTDDDLRWKTYYAIYRDPFLSRYAPGGGLLWGHRHAFGGGFLGLGPSRFPGTEPAGNYPIHIIVKNLHVTLFGVVDNNADKNAAGIKTSGVAGNLGVENELMVEKSDKK